MEEGSDGERDADFEMSDFESTDESKSVMWQMRKSGPK